MNESKILRTACDAKWYAHAYSEYLADVAQTTSNLMAALQVLLSYDSISVAGFRDTLSEYGVNPDARIILGEYGEITAIDLAVYAWHTLEQTEGYMSTYDFSVEEAFSIIRETWTQSVISSKAFDAYSIDSPDVVNRVSKFLQDVQTQFSIDNTVRSTVGYYQSMISAAPNVSDFVNQFVSATGVDDAEASDDPMAYINSDVYKYTGNTPGIALDFTTVNKAVASTVSVAATAIKGVFSVIGRGVSWLFNKAKKYVVDTVIDPAVCEYIGDDSSNEGYIDGFAWYGEFSPNVTYSHFDTGGQFANLFYGFYDEYAEKWIKIKLKLGEFLFRIISDDTKWQCYFKPVAVDVDFFKTNYTGSTREPQYNVNDHDQSLDEYITWLKGVMEYIQPLSKDATKEQIYRGLAFSTILMGSISVFALAEVYEHVHGSKIGNISNSSSRFDDLSEFYSFDPILESYYVTNAKILTAAAGDPSSQYNIQNCLDWSSSIGVSLYDTIPTYSIQAMMTDIIAIWAMCRTERIDYPINYTFVPYSNNHTSFSPSSWRIKTDTAIAETRDRFIEAAIMAVVVIAAIVFVGAALTKVSKNAFFKRQQTIGQLENKMWNGGVLTPAERRKYIRYNRKQNASNWLSTGVADPSSSLSNSSQSIIKLIQG